MLALRESIDAVVARPSPMPSLARPDGAELHWDAIGDGPTVILVQHIWSYPALYEALIVDLSRDHRFVTYDPRGAGESTRMGPYDLETDAADLEAVVEAAAGADVAFALGFGFNVAVRVAARRPDLIRSLLVGTPTAGGVLPRAELPAGEGLIASDSVVEMLRRLVATDFRAALRTLVPAANPALSEEELRQRVDAVAAYTSQDAVIGRTDAWMSDDLRDVAALGDRLWVAYGEEYVLLPEMAARVREVLPDAHLEKAAEGPISRPDLAAATVRRMTQGAGGRGPEDDEGNRSAPVA